MTAAVEVLELERGEGERPGGKRFGELVHRVLAALDLDADPAAVEATVRAFARVLGATEEERAAARALVGGVLGHELVRRAAAAGAGGPDALRREAPVFLPLPDGRLAEGVVDLAFREGESGWTVVDFKTDREVSGARDDYREQVRLYAEAVAAATGEPARGVLLVL